MTEGISANLDLLRTIAVLLVLGQHLFFRFPVAWMQFLAGRSLGLFGVLLFFVHTSLVLMFSMDRSLLRRPALFKNFYTRRIFRIYPLAVVAVLAVLFLHLDSDVNGIHGLTYHPAKLSMRAVVGELLLVQNVAGVRSNPNVLWSLPFELQMYVILPFLFVLSRSRPLFRPLLYLWCISAIAGWIQPHTHGPFQRFGIELFSLLQFVPCFLPGVIAFSLLPQRARFRAWLWPAFILVLLVTFAIFPILQVGWFLCLALGLMIPMFPEIRANWLRVASHHIATYSYGIYICHPFCLWFVFEVMASSPWWIKGLVLVSSLVVLPVSAYHCIEKPLIQAGQKIASRWADPPQRVQAAAA